MSWVYEQDVLMCILCCVYELGLRTRCVDAHLVLLLTCVGVPSSEHANMVHSVFNCTLCLTWQVSVNISIFLCYHHSIVADRFLRTVNKRTFMTCQYIYTRIGACDNSTDTLC